MSISNLIKRLQDIMRKDSGINGDAQRIDQMSWMFFLKAYDAKEDEWRLYDANYRSLIPENLKWKNWAIDDKSNNVLTGDALLNLVNNELMPTLKKLEVTEKVPLKQRIVKYVFSDAQNYIKNGILLRQVINVINELDFSKYKERNEFGTIYETILKSLQNAGNAGEFYTPRSVTDFMVEMINPELGETVADFACGTGGFLTSTLNHLVPKTLTPEDRNKYNNTIFGIEKKPMPYILCITNMLIHDVDNPRIYYMNSLEKNVREYKEEDKFDIVLMNPPYGGEELEAIKNNFPTDLRSSETADLFIDIIMYRLKKNGRCGVIIPDGFLFGGDAAKTAIKTKLINDFNLHTIIRLPHSVFAPYTTITTNILFFDNTKSTEETWVYRMDMPEGYKHFSKTKPILKEHFNPVRDWWNDRQEIEIDGFSKSKKFMRQEIIDNHYNLDLCGYPHIEEEILRPMELITKYKEERSVLDSKIKITLDEIMRLLSEDKQQ